MNRKNVLDTLEFENDGVFYHDVNTITTIKIDSLILDRQWNLPLELNSVKMKFMAKAFLISRLKQTRTKRAMYFDRRTDYLLCEIFMN